MMCLQHEITGLIRSETKFTGFGNSKIPSLIN